ncbi:hypothetical protein [Chitinophaga sp. YIM B06452]|uniref:hypothetical protein n=1 Tax=Chitinophaga sp. YIM B06452 TaxID=3082158 RepID=UPI0031FF34B5
MTVLTQLQEKELSWDQMREEFGAYLGLETPVPSAVLKKAINDEKYACYLMAARNAPAYLQTLFNVPADLQEDRSNLQLLKKAAGSLLKWSASGFGYADEAVYAKRLSACQSCEYLRAAPDQAVYHLKKKKEDMQVCSACGCVASRKARLRSESCPVADKTDASLNRWGEKMKS